MTSFVSEANDGRQRIDQADAMKKLTHSPPPRGYGEPKRIEG